MCWLQFLCAIYLLQCNYGSIYHPDRNVSDTIAIYWGQDSAGNYIEKNLSYYCDLGNNYDGMEAISCLYYIKIPKQYYIQ